MTDRTCIACGTEIVPGPRERNSKKWCSEPCRIRNYYRRHPGKAAERKAKARATFCPIYVEPCDECGEMKTWRYKRRLRRTCSHACANAFKARAAREKYALDPEAERRRVNDWRAAHATPCVDCGEPTVGITATQCGACQKRRAGRLAVASRRQQAAAKIHATWMSTRTVSPLAIEMGRKGRMEVARRESTGVATGPFYMGSCAKCSGPFTTTYRDALYCSSKCSGSRYWINDRRRFGIYDRDAWICQICFQPVPRVARAPHPLSPSLDHIVPQSERPGDHRDENLRLSHLLCNSIRSDESNPTWRDLIPAT